MQAQQAPLAPLIFADAERPLGERLMKLALETDRIEGYTEPHAVMIARLAETIGGQMGLHGQDLTALKFAALAHDIGERGLKRNYLLQPNALSWEERLDLWRHPILGEQSAAELQLPRQTQLLIRWHQEWWNGQGYPDGLAGASIPVGARILRAVDSYCALISQRPYRQRYELPEAEQVIADMSGIEFDPHIAKLLLAVVVAERRQREAEVWSIPPAFEPSFVSAVEEASTLEAPVLEVIDGEIPSPVYAPDADTLTDFGAVERQTFQPAADNVISELQSLESTNVPNEGGELLLEQKPVQVPAESLLPSAPAALAELEATTILAPPVLEELEAIPTPVAAHNELLAAAPYGDVLVHQSFDDELPMQSEVSHASPSVSHDPASDDQQEPAPKIPS
ncbi:MAG: HD domain-containing phosphohydrolase [Blastocatellia bacterium]